MHELALCQALIAQVETLAREHQARGVAGVRLLVGPLSGAEPALLQSAFPLAAAGTVLDGAVLLIDAAPVLVACGSCGAESQATPNRLLCGACGDWRTRVVSGDELTLASVELVLEPGRMTDGATREAAIHV